MTSSGEVELTVTSDGIRLPVQARPSAKKNGILGVHDGRLKVAVTQAPEQGKANKAIVDVLAKLLGLKRSQIALQSGATSTQKNFIVTGVTQDELNARLQPFI
ncbi:DUF167 domain-containing protein [Calycomorphotria hydatis]|uniref:UPF0235 protein V22_14070 n=1 Tax=Calycomorphotria hydatis TaxID=2528027 RepID=A0A517T722_9PLAN|nr:DUF167 domain-containing protein [Calycomorphotria hydatis]QDT64176.1 hypothetical protein V22_14070 [Calycomorphotria hydatis]